MRVLIVEDEPMAQQNLVRTLTQHYPDLQIVGATGSVRETVEWLRTPGNIADVIFMDVELSDGDCFEIFRQVDVSARVVMTTAYDSYAVRAFEVNSIDYLLKPIGAADLRRALDKLEALRHTAPTQESLSVLIGQLQRREHYKTHFLIPFKGNKLLPLAVEQVQYFCIADGVTKAVVSDQERYTVPCTLDELADSLDPECFFRVNRQYLISRGAVQDIDLWFNNRLAINLKVPTDGKVLVSKLRVNEFKSWFAGR